MKTRERGWVMPMALLGLGLVSALASAAWRHAQQGTETFGHELRREQAHQQAQALLQLTQAAIAQGHDWPEGAEVQSMDTSDSFWSAPGWRLHRITVTGRMGPSRVVLQGTWIQALDEQGQSLKASSPLRLSWREVWQ
jgi:hypothetical protein